MPPEIGALFVDGASLAWGLDSVLFSPGRGWAGAIPSASVFEASPFGLPDCDPGAGDVALVLSLVFEATTFGASGVRSGKTNELRNVSCSESSFFVFRITTA